MHLPWPTPREMALLLSIGEAVEKVQAMLPPPVPSFNERLVWQVREIYDQLITSHPDAAPYVPLIVMNRLVRPWEALAPAPDAVAPVPTKR